MPRVDNLLKRMAQLEASDLHMISGYPLRFRIDGDLSTAAEAPVPWAECQKMFEEMIPERLRNDFDNRRDVDFAYTIPTVGRFRCNLFHHERGLGGVFRFIPKEIPQLADLDLPEGVRRLADLHEGLVLVTGPTGSGKSTTLAALLDIINSEQKRHVITIEDPIEFIHPAKNSVVAQREIGIHAEDFARAVRAAMREDPDVLLVGEMRDLETVQNVLAAAEAGILVFATLHTNTAANTMDRVIDFFPGPKQDQARSMLSESLVGIVSQLLIPKADGPGRVPATEVLLQNQALPKLVREGKSGMIQTLIQSGKNDGMVSLDDSLLALVRQRAIDREEALRRAQDRAGMANALGMKI